MRLPLEDRREEALRIIREELARGTGWDEIAERLTRELGVRATPEMAKYFWAKHSDVAEAASLAGLGLSELESSAGSVDLGEPLRLEDEVEWLYRVAKRRVKVYLELESNMNLPMPDTDRALRTAIDLLRLKAELGRKETALGEYERILRRVFGLGESGEETGEAGDSE